MNRINTSNKAIEVKKFDPSFNQLSMWMLEQDNSTDAYNLNYTLELKGNINFNTLYQSIKATINAHPVFKYNFKLIENELKIIQNMSKECNILLLEGKDYTNYKKDVISIFDNYLYYIYIFKINDSKVKIVFNIHHIIFDGYSLEILVREIQNRYNGLNIEKEKEPYSNFVKEEYNCNYNKTYNDDICYWKEKLKNISTTNTSLDSSNLSNKGSIKNVISTEKTEVLKEMAKKHKTTIYNLLLTIFSITLSSFNSKTTNYIGIPVLGRDNPNYRNTIGYFANTAVLKLTNDFHKKTNEQMSENQNELFQTLEKSKVPFGQIVKELNPKRSESLQFLDTFFTFHQTTKTREFAKDIQMSLKTLQNQDLQFDFNLDIELDSKLKINLDFNKDVYTNSFANSFLTSFVYMIENIEVNSHKEIKNLNLLNQKQLEDLTKISDTNKNNITTEYEDLFCLFNKTVAKFPDNLCITFKNKQIKYKESLMYINQIAKSLTDNHIVQGSKVGIRMRKHPDTVFSILAVLKLGAIFIPLSPSEPEQRLNYIVDNAEIELILDSGIRKETDVNINFIKTQYNSFTNKNVNNRNDIAYIIYTSGSTGKPKGVSITTKSVINVVSHFTSSLELNSQKKVVFLTPLTFDISILEIFLPIHCGATLSISPCDLSEDVTEVKDFLDGFVPDVLQGTPSSFHYLIDNGWKGNKETTLLVGGEQLDYELANYLTDNFINVFNVYGPSETTIWSTNKKITKKSIRKDVNNIGRPISNTRVMIANHYNQFLPNNVLGEILIAGDGVSSGYISNSKLNNEKFIVMEFNDTYELYYKTGDLGYFNEEGELLIVGRKDYQIKLRGHRIDPFDIESNINEHDSIEKSLVIEKNNILIAFVIKKNDVMERELKQFLVDRLPNYMIPSIISIVDNFPTNSNGKIDRNKLSNKINKQKIDCEVSILETETMKSLYQIWKDVLKTNEINQKSNFFDIGGHSLLIVKLINQIRDQMGIDINISDVFKYQTLGELSFYLDNSEIKQVRVEKVGFVEKVGKTKSYILGTSSGKLNSYTQFIQTFNRDYSLYGLQFNISMSKIDFRYLIREFANIISNDYRPGDNINLIGYSLGGNLAVLLAIELEKRNIHVKYVFLIDSENINKVWDNRLLQDSYYFRNHIQNKLSIKIDENKPIDIDKYLRRLYYHRKKMGELAEINFIDFKKNIYKQKTSLQELQKIQISKYKGEVISITASENPYFQNMGWEDVLLGEVREYQVEANHNNILRFPNIRAVLLVIFKYLNKY